MLQPAAGHEAAHWGIIPAFGIFAVSVSGHSSLPSIRSSMAKPHLFGRVLNLAFIAMATIYSLTAGLGYYYFGNDTSPLITRDLAVKAPFSGRSFLLPGLTVERVVDVFIALNAYTTYPLLVVVLQDMALGALPRGSKAARSTALPFIARLLFFAAGSLLSLATFGVLPLFMSLIGGFCSLSCSLLLPALFYAALYWNELRTSGQVGIMALLVFGCCLLTLIVTSDLQQLVTKLHVHIERH